MKDRKPCDLKGLNYNPWALERLTDREYASYYFTHKKLQANRVIVDYMQINTLKSELQPSRDSDHSKFYETCKGLTQDRRLDIKLKLEFGLGQIFKELLQVFQGSMKNRVHKVMDISSFSRMNNDDQGWSDFAHLLMRSLEETMYVSVKGGGKILRHLTTEVGKVWHQTYRDRRSASQHEKEEAFSQAV